MQKQIEILIAFKHLIVITKVSITTTTALVITTMIIRARTTISVSINN